MAAESWTWMVLIIYDSKNKKGRWHIYWRQVTKCKGLFEVFLGVFRSAYGVDIRGCIIIKKDYLMSGSSVS